MVYNNNSGQHEATKV